MVHTLIHNVKYRPIILKYDWWANAKISVSRRFLISHWFRRGAFRSTWPAQWTWPSRPSVDLTPWPAGDDCRPLDKVSPRVRGRRRARNQSIVGSMYCWINTGLTSATLAQHWTNSGVEIWCYRRNNSGWRADWGRAGGGGGGGEGAGL